MRLKKYTPVLIIFVLLFSMYFISCTNENGSEYIEKTDIIKETTPNSNLGENSLSEDSWFIKEGWIYYIDFNRGCCICKIKLDGTGYQVLVQSPDSRYNLVFANTNIYYCAHGDLWQVGLDGRNNIETKIDGNNVSGITEMVSSGSSLFLKVNKDREEIVKIYPSNSIQVVYGGVAKNLQYVEDSLFFQTPIQDNCIIKYDDNTSTIIQLDVKNTVFMKAIGSFIFFTDEEDKLYRMNLKTKVISNLGNHPVSSLSIVENEIFFVSLNKVYKMLWNGSQVKNICEDLCHTLKKYNDDVYFVNEIFPFYYNIYLIPFKENTPIPIQDRFKRDNPKENLMKESVINVSSNNRRQGKMSFSDNIPYIAVYQGQNQYSIKQINSKRLSKIDRKLEEFSIKSIYSIYTNKQDAYIFSYGENDSHIVNKISPFGDIIIIDGPLS